MTNIDQIRKILNQNDEQGKSVMIIASIDDQQKIISCLSPANSQFNKRIFNQFVNKRLFFSYFSIDNRFIFDFVGKSKFTDKYKNNKYKETKR